MYEPPQLIGTEHLVHDRITELRITAEEVHERSAREELRRRTGLIERTRGSVGRRLISLGTTVAGDGA